MKIHYQTSTPEVIIATPAHGSAFDIAGKNIVSTNAMETALRLVAKTINNKNK